jgi:hypothetical protein
MLEFLCDYLQNKNEFIYFVINSNFDETSIEVDRAFYGSKHYRKVLSETLNGFKYNIENKIIPYSMSYFIHQKNLWAVVVKISLSKNIIISAYRSFVDNENEMVYYEGCIESEDFTNNLNKEKEGASTLFKEFIRLFSVAQEQIKTDLYVYIFNPCYTDQYFEGTVSMAMTKGIDKSELKLLASLFLSLFADQYANEKQRQAICVAVSAIMARNMSHNLGSHLITNTKNYFGRMGEEQQNVQLAADLRGIRHLLQYTQERMDYIATITSGDHYPLGTLNFKAQIFDELTIDDFSKRHKTKNISNFFLKYLVYSEKYTHGTSIDEGYKDLELIVKYIDKEGDKYYFSPSVQTGKNTEDEINDNDDAKNTISKLNFAVPGGIMSRHAFFNIVENIIRNSAKHSKTDSNESLKITIELNENIKKDYCQVRIYDNKTGGENVKAEIEKRLQEIQILTSEGLLEKSNKGLKEMLISSLWLQGMPIFEELAKIESELDGEQKLALIEQFLKPGTFGKDRYLGYSFDVKLFKPVHHIEYNGDCIEAGELLKICADVTTCYHDEISIKNNKGEKTLKKLREIFPRFVLLEEKYKEQKQGNNEKNLLLKFRKNVLYFIEVNNLIEKDPLEALKKTVFEVDLDKKSTESGEKVFELSSIENQALFKYCLSHNFDKEDPAKYVINIESTLYKGENEQIDGVDYCTFRKDDDKRHIVFENHLTSAALLTQWEKYTKVYGTETAYLDSISGGDFTSTVVQPVFLKDEIQRNKLIESAITSLAIIDERIIQKIHSASVIRFDDRDEINKQRIEKVREYLQDSLSEKTESEILNSLKQINSSLGSRIEEALNEQKTKIPDYDFHSEKIKNFVLNSFNFLVEDGQLGELATNWKKSFVYDLSFENNTGVVKNANNTAIADITEEGVKVRPDCKIEKSKFVTIHLGLLEKYRDFLIARSDKTLSKEDQSDIIKNIMQEIKKTFADENRECFIAIHSGRGNFSKELEEDLETYPFLSLSSLEAVFDNSKYLLSQLFYNTIYYGKGNFNNNEGH